MASHTSMADRFRRCMSPSLSNVTQQAPQQSQSQSHSPAPTIERVHVPIQLQPHLRRQWSTGNLSLASSPNSSPPMYAISSSPSSQSPSPSSPSASTPSASVPEPRCCSSLPSWVDPPRGSSPLLSALSNLSLAISQSQAQALSQSQSSPPISTPPPCHTPPVQVHFQSSSPQLRRRNSMSAHILPSNSNANATANFHVGSPSPSPSMHVPSPPSFLWVNGGSGVIGSATVGVCTSGVVQLNSQIVSNMVQSCVTWASQFRPSEHNISALLCWRDKIWIGTEKGTLSIWTLNQDNQSIQRTVPEFLAHEHKISSLVSAKCVSGDTVWTATNFGECKIWDAETHALRNTVRLPERFGLQAITGLLSKDSLVWGFLYQDVIIWDAEGNLYGTYSVGCAGIGCATLVTQYCIWLTSGSKINVVTLSKEKCDEMHAHWQSKNGPDIGSKLVSAFKEEDTQWFSTDERDSTIDHSLTCIKLMGDHIWTGDVSGYLCVWDPLTRELTWRNDPIGKRAKITALCDVSMRNPPCVLSGYDDGLVCMWHCETYHCLCEWRVHSPALDFTISIDMIVLALSFNSEGTVCAWGLEPHKDPPPGILVDESAKYVGGLYESGGKQLKQGLGELHLIQGTQTALYAGTWLNDKRNGFGVEYSSSGQYYGHWREDEKYGFGVSIQPDGTTFSGIFAKGKPKGQGTMHFPNGDSLTGMFDGTNITGSLIKSPSQEGGDSLPEGRYQKWRFLCPVIPEDKQIALFNFPYEEVQKPSKWADHILSRFTEKQINQRIFCILLNDLNHPFGQCVYKFSRIFTVCYHGTPRKEAALLLADAIDDINSFADQIVRCCESLLGPLNSLKRLEWVHWTKTVIIGNVSTDLFALYRRTYKTEAQTLVMNLNSLRLRSLKELGVSRKLCLWESHFQRMPKPIENTVSWPGTNSSPYEPRTLSKSPSFPEIPPLQLDEQPERTSPIGTPPCVPTKEGRLPSYGFQEERNSQLHLEASPPQNCITPSPTCLTTPTHTPSSPPVAQSLSYSNPNSPQTAHSLWSPCVDQSACVPYGLSIKHLRLLSRCNSIQAVVECISRASNAIEKDIELFYKQTSPSDIPHIELGPDDRLSILTYMMIKANVSDIPAKLAFVSDFGDKRLLSENALFRVSQLEQAVSYNKSLQWEVTDESGIVVSIQVLEERLLNCLDVQSIPGQDSVITHWLSELLLLCGTLPCSISVNDEGMLTRPPLLVSLKNDKLKWIHLLKDTSYWKVAKDVLGTIGIELQPLRPKTVELELRFSSAYSSQVYLHLSKKADLHGMM